MSAAELMQHPLETQLRKDQRKFKPNPQILVVEDDITSEPLWEHIIRLASPRAYFDWATTESDAEKLIQHAKQTGQPYDLVISDVFLSGSRTGIDLWNRFKDDLGGKIVLISSIDHDKFIRYCGDSKQLPMYIKKPLNLSHCIETVYSTLKKR